ncbi:dephospho-CoA kinase [Atopobacter phocae]|uniref:dephospho-CoA kinase n=1 Tax=Atopobacter phocae TaxID=136492 RepID=UPI00047153BC|nr:dephospho-CoA kinase [Atopobacter phocae]
MARIIGLTGGIASGKSYVATLLKEKQIPVVDADRISHQVLVDDEAVLKQIRAMFGAEVFTETGAIDRSKLGAIVFHNDDKRYELNRITHPEIKRRMLNEIERYKKQGAHLIVMDVPLLFETNYDQQVDQIVLVFVDQAIQVQRLMARDQIDQELAQLKIKSQLPLSYKATLADVVIDNSKTREETKAQVEAWLESVSSR